MQTLDHELVLRVLDIVGNNPYVEEVWFVLLFEHVLEAVVSAVHFEIRAKDNNLLFQGVLFICDTATDPGIHHSQKIIQVVLLVLKTAVQLVLVFA